jgi:beta-galactosidase beta subunit
MKIYALVFALSIGLLPAMGADNPVDYYSAAQLRTIGNTLSTQAKTQSIALALQPLKTYGNDATQMAFRNTSGQAELHQHFSDFDVVVAGDATLLSGGKIVDPQTTQEGEVRGKSIEGGQSQALHPGDVVHILPNTPHQLLLQPGHTFTYFVVKVKQ